MDLMRRVEPTQPSSIVMVSCEDLKRQCYEGGIRIPFIARWKGRVKEGVTNDLPFAFYDLMPTFCDVAGVRNFPKRYINKKKTVELFRMESLFSQP